MKLQQTPQPMNQRGNANMMKYKVVEKFVSINGEGQASGQLAIFIRFAECNLDCSYCDTQWANEESVDYESMTAEEIHKYIKTTGVKNITLTGGEPLIQDGMLELVTLLCEDENLSIEIETNGSKHINDFTAIKKNPPSITMDYKLASSSMEQAMKAENFEYLTKKDTLKFVVGNLFDLERAKQIIETHDLTNRTTVYISPIFSEIHMDEIVNFMKEHRLNNVTLQMQLHKVIWDPEERGV